MKEKITDEKLDELAESYSFATGYVGFRNGYLTAWQTHQSTIDKLMSIIEIQREALDKMTDHGLGHYEDCDYMEYEEDESICNCKVGKLNADCVRKLAETDKMLKELKGAE